MQPEIMPTPDLSGSQSVDRALRLLALVGRESASGLPFPSLKGDVPLGPAFGLLRPKAYLCRTCGKVVINCK